MRTKQELVDFTDFTFASKEKVKEYKREFVQKGYKVCQQYYLSLLVECKSSMHNNRIETVRKVKNSETCSEFLDNMVYIKKDDITGFNYSKNYPEQVARYTYK